MPASLGFKHCRKEKVMSENILLISDTMIKERTAIHGNIDPKLIYPDIKVAQDMYIMPILGTALYNKLLTAIGDGSISSDTTNVNYKNLIDKYLVDALMYYTLSELPTTISYQFWNKGVTRKIGQDSENPSMSELIDLSNKYKNRAEFYAQRLKQWIRQNAATMFPEYLNPGNGIDTVTPEHRAFTMPIYLGPEGYRRDDDCCDGFGFNNQPYKP
jgi:hypothetical protein